MRISDWSSDVCSSDLVIEAGRPDRAQGDVAPAAVWIEAEDRARDALLPRLVGIIARLSLDRPVADIGRGHRHQRRMNGPARARRSEEHTSELQSLMRISYAVFCLKKKNTTQKINNV